MRAFLLSIFCFLLGGCLGSQNPAPVTIYGTSAGEGSAGVHNIVESDTLWSISNRYNLSMRDIISYNHLKAPYKLSVGQRLRLPPPREYEVRAGDTIYAVSRIFDVSMTDLVRMNNLQNPYVIVPGQILQLPLERTQDERVQDTQVASVPSAQSGEHIPAPSQKPARLSNASRAKITNQTPARSSSRFLRPVSGDVISGYGPKNGGTYNDGINIRAPRGSAVKAAENGVVVYVGNELKGSGNLVLVRHADRWMSAYAHLDSISVKRGQTLARGAKLGTVGSTGSVSEPQLHFELRRGTKAINPQSYL